MSEEKVPERKWWELSRLAPPGKLDLVIWVLCAAALLFFVLTLVGFSGRDGGDGDAGALSPEARKWKRAAEKEADARKASEIRSHQLETKLSEALKDKVVLQRKSAKLEKEANGHQQETDGLKSELENLRKEYDEKAGHLKRLETDTRRLGDDAGLVVTLRDKIETLEGTLSDRDETIASLRSDARTANSEKAGMQGELNRLKNELKRKEANIDERDERIEKVEADLRATENPTMPEEEAGRYYREVAAEYTSISDEDERIEYLSKARTALAGTSYENSAHGLWKRAGRAKQRRIDAAANKVYVAAKNQVWCNPKDQDGNIRHLKEALEKVRGSRYETEIQKMLDRQVRAKEKAEGGG